METVDWTRCNGPLIVRMHIFHIYDVVRFVDAVIIESVAGTALRFPEMTAKQFKTEYNKAHSIFHR